MLRGFPILKVFGLDGVARFVGEVRFKAGSVYVEGCPLDLNFQKQVGWEPDYQCVCRGLSLSGGAPSSSTGRRPAQTPT